jgi:hypothetical protein
MNIQKSYNKNNKSLIISFLKIGDFKVNELDIMKSICQIFEKHNVDFLKSNLSEEHINQNLHHGMYETHNNFKIRLINASDNLRAIDIFEKSLNVNLSRESIS